jgi:hypothetical protein
MIQLSRFLSLAMACVALSGCVIATPTGVSGLLKNGPEKTPVELQAIQTREFESDKSRLLSVFITVFQDSGYTLEQADLPVGLITARTPIEERALTVQETASDRLVKLFPDTMASGLTLKTSRTINVLVSEITAKRSKARVSMVAHKRIGDGVSSDVIETNPDVYQAIFAKVQQGLFLKRNIE